MYAPKDRMPDYMKQKRVELKGDIDKYTIIGGDFNIPL